MAASPFSGPHSRGRKQYVDQNDGISSCKKCCQAAFFPASPPPPRYAVEKRTPQKRIIIPSTKTGSMATEYLHLHLHLHLHPTRPTPPHPTPPHPTPPHLAPPHPTPPRLAFTACHQAANHVTRLTSHGPQAVAQKTYSGFNGADITDFKSLSASGSDFTAAEGRLTSKGRSSRVPQTLRRMPAGHRARARVRRPCEQQWECGRATGAGGASSILMSSPRVLDAGPWVRHRPLLRDTGGGGGQGFWQTHPHTHNRKNFPQEKNEIYQRGPNLEVDFRYTNFVLTSGPPPPCVTFRWVEVSLRGPGQLPFLPSRAACPPPPQCSIIKQPLSKGLVQQEMHGGGGVPRDELEVGGGGGLV